MTLTRDQILKAKDLPRETVDVPEWGGNVIVSALSGTNRDAFEALLTTPEGEPNLHNMRAKLAAACIVNEAGERLFSDADIAVLGQKSGAALDRVAKIAQRINRLGNTQLEELRGN